MSQEIKAAQATAEPPQDFEHERPPRRNFLLKLGVLLGGLSSIVAGVPIVGYILGPVVIEGDKWVSIPGTLEDFKPGKTRLVQVNNQLARPWDGDSAKLALYVRRLEGDTFLCLSVYCTHLGCPVSWFEQSGLFLCPCHGGVYYADGQRASGPPPRGLYHYPYRIVKKNQLQVRVGHLPTLHDVPAENKAADSETLG